MWHGLLYPDHQPAWVFLPKYYRLYPSRLPKHAGDFSGRKLYQVLAVLDAHHLRNRLIGKILVAVDIDLLQRKQAAFDNKPAPYDNRAYGD